MKILLSGFGAFDTFKENPSSMVLSLLKNEDLPFDLETVLLPVSFDKCFEVLKEKINSTKPDAVIGMGLAGIRDEITPERVAINLIEARIPDNEGQQPLGKKVVEGGSDGLFTSLPIKAMVKAATDLDYKASVSNTAGTYICNYLMFKIIHYTNQQNILGGFIHLPPTIEMNKEKGMKLEDIKKALTTMLSTLDQPDNELSINSGSEC